MENTILIICSTFLLVLVAYWIMPIKKMKAVNEALKSLLHILPITKIIGAITQSETKEKH